MKRDLISLKDFSGKEIADILTLARTLKRQKGKLSGQLKGKSVGLVFQKPSNRTRVSFEVGVWQLGGTCVYLGPEEINLGKRETTSDVAQTLSRYLDCIVARTFAHQDVIDLAKYATVPVINGLSDLFHPCQALADLMIIQEKFKKLKNLNLAYIGDGNNVCHSLMLGCAKMGINMSVATPLGYAPQQEVMDLAEGFAAKSGARIQHTLSAPAAIKGTHVIYTDTWVSMGQEKETQERLKIFSNYQVNAELLKQADKNYIFLHCLPAHRGQEVTEDIIDGPHSHIFDQAENRLHVQKAVLISLLAKGKK